MKSTTPNDLDEILFSLEWEATFEKMNREKRKQFKAQIQALITKSLIAELEKWAEAAIDSKPTRYDFQDRIKELRREN